MSGFSGGSSFTSLLSAVEPERFDGFAMLNGGMFGWGNADEAQATIEKREAEGLAGPISSLSGKPVYIFSGIEDSVVAPEAQEKQKLFYE